MKRFSLIFLCLWSIASNAQDIQLHYDLRHSVDPKLNRKNFPMICFQYFKNLDTVSTGSFLFKAQSFLSGDQHNMGEVFMQVSQTIKFWKPKVYLALQYSGGLGIASPSFGYHIGNRYGIGISYPFVWKKAFFNAAASYRFNPFKTATHDAQATFYLGRGLLNYRIFMEGSFTAFTENHNPGISDPAPRGKKFAFYGDPQVWFKIKKGFSVGSRISVYYNILGNPGAFQAYPTIGSKYNF
ncbi:DUF5020 family protein [Dyadobacter arcticus]|uniref:DUF5020 family protein n=1 Tax=Dyadobacter arcticus TaxID=1078754 RepID=A0ABX0USC3_9BACT|nr:DUF5020 family protein [Dyadobacter arcticus]NIJ53886.1 hypothetical protein [Dyadobacter arcticus]